MTPRTMSDELRQLLQSDVLSPGLFLGLDCAPVAEIAGLAGIKWVVVDLEHSGVTRADIGPVVVAANSVGIPVIVRVTSPDRSEIGWVVDQGAAGVMVPRVESFDEARAVTRHFTYPPAGDRGVASYTRAASWGARALTDVSPPVCIIQIETPGALADVDRICSLEGVDALFVGPLDLSAALGVLQDFDHPSYQAALGRVLASGQTHDTPVGSIAGDDSRAAQLAAQGVSFVALGSDGMTLRAALTQKVALFTQSAAHTPANNTGGFDA